MSHIKNTAENTNESNHSNNYINQNDRTQEVDLPIPEKKNDDITTGKEEIGEKDLERAGRINTEESTEKNEKERQFKTGFDVNKTNEQQSKDKRGDENQKLERDDTNQTKTQDASWAQNKMNETDKQQNSKENGDVEKLKDTREDSILDRPKTETYEKNQKEDIGGKIKKDNYTHTSEEEKRDEQNRKQKEDNKRSSENTDKKNL
ncbi:MAG: hypothetical protein ABI543_08080 [Ignavibacteria bacterium]